MSTDIVFKASALVVAYGITFLGKLKFSSTRFAVFAAIIKCLPILYLCLESGLKSDEFSEAIARGLFLSSIGDFCIDLDAVPAIAKRLPKDLFFTVGLLSFLCAHILYLMAYASDVGGVIPAISRGILSMVTFFGFGGGVYVYSFPALPADLKVPVGVYVVVISAMTHCACVRSQSEDALASGGQQSLSLGLYGAMLFMLSDSVLALARFRPRGLEIPLPKLWVMLTYYTAQICIALSAITRNILD